MKLLATGDSEPGVDPIDVFAPYVAGLRTSALQ